MAVCAGVCGSRGSCGCACECVAGRVCVWYGVCVQQVWWRHGSSGVCARSVCMVCGVCVRECVVVCGVCVEVRRVCGYTCFAMGM